MAIGDIGRLVQADETLNHQIADTSDATQLAFEKRTAQAEIGASSADLLSHVTGSARSSLLLLSKERS